MPIKRTISSYFLELSTYYPVIAVTGPRQSGKTTLAKELFPKKKYVNLEKGSNKEFAKEDLNAFLKEYEEGAIFDEVQSVPELLSEIQVLVDENPEKGRFILTGSYNFKLMEGLSQSLSGRVGLIKLFPFSKEELETERKTNEINEVILNGLYPGKYSNDIPQDIFYENYIDTYVEKDVRRLENIQSSSDFRKFIKLTASRSGSLVNFSNLSNDCGVSDDTIRRWINLLEVSYIIFHLPPWFKNINKRLIKHPKIFFYDTGLLCKLLGITTTEQLKLHPLYGNIYENFQILEIFKLINNKHYSAECSFYKSYDGQEVDLVLEHNNKMHLLEIKSAHTFKSEFFKGIKSLTKLLGEEQTGTRAVCLGGALSQRRTDGLIISANDFAKTIEKEIFT